MERKLSVVADDREARTGVVRHLLARTDCDVVVRRLVLADYLVDGRLLIERKTWPDFVASVVDGRLFRQGCRLAAAPLPAVMLLEGGEAGIEASAMSREAIQGALISMSVVLGIPVLRSRDADDSARLMIYAGRQLARVVSGAVPRPGFRPRTRRRIQLHVLQGLPGVGPARAARLLDALGSVEAVLSAPADALRRVPGVGPTVAQAIRWVASEPGQCHGNGADRRHSTCSESDERYCRR
jgi:ERCC4-type nuclease